jgi:MoaA/NifB/PqqE/SkfB family radical SAM enzyme
MTGYDKYNRNRWDQVIKKVHTLSRMAGVTNVMMTGKGEPLLNYFGLVRAIQMFSEFPVELQTNGIWLNENSPALKELAKVGLDVVAVSIDRMSDFERFAKLYEATKANNRMLRICINVVSNRYLTNDIKVILDEAIRVKADQLLFRRVTIPKILTNTSEAEKTRGWIVNNVDFEMYEMLHNEFKRMISEQNDLVRRMPHGALVYDYKNEISVSFSDYCVQECNNTDDIRSLILLTDGHVYTSWDKKSSILL